MALELSVPGWLVLRSLLESERAYRFVLLICV
jgi:hypothetical protein